jgi:hypothetical protein
MGSLYVISYTIGGMAMTARTVVGTIVGGRVVLPTPINAPDGTNVVVTIEPTAAPSRQATELLSHPAIGMWKDRKDMADSAAWVDAQRLKWRDRIHRRD